MPEFNPDPFSDGHDHVPLAMFRQGSILAGRSDGEPEEINGSPGQVPTMQASGSVEFRTPVVGATSLGELSDVDLGGLQDGQGLLYDANSQKFVPAGAAQAVVYATLRSEDLALPDDGSSVQVPWSVLLQSGIAVNGDTFNIDISSGSLYWFQLQAAFNSGGQSSVSVSPNISGFAAVYATAADVQSFSLGRMVRLSNGQSFVTYAQQVGGTNVTANIYLEIFRVF